LGVMSVIGCGYFFVGPANLRFDSIFRNFIQGQQYVGMPYPVVLPAFMSRFRSVRSSLVRVTRYFYLTLSLYPPGYYYRETLDLP
jgi:hypothetical protein